MIKLYFTALLCALVLGAFFYGKSVGFSKCEKQNFQIQINADKQNQINKRVINETVYKHGVNDIRNILRDKYTIAE